MPNSRQDAALLPEAKIGGGSRVNGRHSERSSAAALKETLAWQVQQAMKKSKINKVQMTRRMQFRRAALDRLLYPGNASFTLQTLCKVAHAIGRDLRIELV